MYRDPRADTLARLESAEQEHARVRKEAMGLVVAADVLRDQLGRKGIEAPRTPALPPGTALPGSLDDLSLADLLRTADAIETDTTRLRSFIDELNSLFAVLSDRAAGRRSELPLEAPPRAVPSVYFVAEALPPWLLIAIPAFAVASALAASSYRATTVGWILPALLLLAPVLFSVARARSRMGFLSRCRMATSVTLESADTGFTKNTNVPMRTARGWTVTREAYTGFTVRNNLRWMGDDGSEGRLVVSGTPYVDGVVLHDSTTAFCVVDLYCAPRPDHRGGWEPTLGIAIWIRVFCVAALFVALAYGFYAAITG